MRVRTRSLELRPDGTGEIGPAHRTRTSVVRVRDAWVRIHHVAEKPVRRGRPVFVLLHGAGLSAREFAALARLLSTAGQVYVLDLPGHAGLPLPHRDERQIRYLAAAAAGALDAEGVRAAVVVGHSMGAQVAAELGVARPDLVAGAVLVAPVVDAAARRLLAQAARFARSSVHESRRTVAVAVRAYAAAGVSWFTEVLPAMMRYPVEHRLAGVRAPVVLLRGEHDAVSPERWLAALEGRLDGAGAGRRTVPGAAHNVVVDDAAPVARAALDVLALSRGGTA